ncbi:pyridoxamine 5'-phosphate oxidase family protein [Agromyces sp. MMS24-K17]|uniref:pyridoxamine 5'-phosphate oxidase family protein n=1 Tax=Agromyces sp. MMS24-K17 TaxID=3372850 RepID=UPI0037540BE2
MDLAGLIEHVRAERHGVVATVSPGGAPEAAFLSITATDRGELVFDAKPDSRKVANLRADGRIAVVVGGEGGTTLQAEGVADLPEGDELERCIAAYLDAFPQFERSVRGGGVVVVRIRLTWARFGDHRAPGAPDVSEVSLG